MIAYRMPRSSNVEMSVSSVAGRVRRPGSRKFSEKGTQLLPFSLPRGMNSSAALACLRPGRHDLAERVIDLAHRLDPLRRCAGLIDRDLLANAAIECSGSWKHIHHHIIGPAGVQTDECIGTATPSRASSPPCAGP